MEAGDAAELYALIDANRDRLARWMPWAADQDLAATERFIAEAEEQLAEENGFQAKIAPEGKIIGTAGFHKIDWVNRNTSIGYWLAGHAEGKGTMTSVVRALLDHAFHEWELHRVEIHCAPGNHRSRGIPERLGFREEARLRETERVSGRYLDGVVYGMLEREWHTESVRSASPRRS
ncbi:MAG: GNAT family N-acetyltransferase [Actinomycetota bacterium]|nr:GNAT family N-acetyltransferase [Actinomycetota bacterium]